MSGSSVFGDWGTTQLRLWLIRDGKPCGRIDGPGIGRLTRASDEVLRELVEPWLERELPRRIVLCGMAGARNGLHETAYAECPVGAARWTASAARLSLASLPLTICAGVASHDDTMRGEETQVFGAAALYPGLNSGRHVIILPGTHSKWVWLEDGRITRLHTFLTGELFALLQSSSLLVTGAAADPASETAGFAEGLAMGCDLPGLVGSLFRARAEQLRQGRSQDWARGFLSGLLIANEIAEAKRSRDLPGHVIVIGDNRLAERYDIALTAFGLDGEPLDMDACTLAGLGLLDADA